MTFAGLWRLSLALCFAALAARAHAGDQPEIGYQDGLLTIRCTDAPLGGVLDKIKAATGMTLILEGVAAGTRLTADVQAQPASLALQRLLEGTGVDYALVMERSDPRRVATLYVGDRKAAAAAGAAPATAAPRAIPPPRPSPVPAIESAPSPLPPEEDDGLIEEEAALVAELEEEATGAVSPPATPSEGSRLDRRSRVRRRGQANQAAQ